MWPCIVTNFFVIKPTRCTNFTNLFWHETQHVSDSSSVHHQEFIHCTHRVPSRSCWKAVYKPIWHIPLLSVQWINSWWWTDKLSETCWVSCQNKFVKLVHLVGFITKIFQAVIFILSSWWDLFLWPRRQRIRPCYLDLEQVHATVFSREPKCFKKEFMHSFVCLFIAT